MGLTKNNAEAHGKLRSKLQTDKNFTRANVNSDHRTKILISCNLLRYGRLCAG